MKRSAKVASDDAALDAADAAHAELDDLLKQAHPCIQKHVIALKAENLKLQDRISTLLVQNLSLENAVRSWKKQVRRSKAEMQESVKADEASRSEKTEMLGRAAFGEDWDTGTKAPV